MKLVKIFGVVMAIHVAVFMFVFAIPGCRSTGKKPTAPAVATSQTSTAGATDLGSPLAGNIESPAEVSAVRFSPTRPGSAAATAVNEPVAPPAAASSDSTYTVVKGDNLWTIARKNGVSVKQITAANNMRADSTLKLGQKLTIPGKTAAPAASAATTNSATAAPAAVASTSTVTHTVKAGETLGGIAKKYQVRVGEIATANNIADPTKLRVGQTLKIPGQSSAARTPAVKPAAPAAPAATGTFTPARPVAPVTAPSAPAPTSPIFTSPLESSPESSPFATPSSADTPLIRVEESGAPRIE